MIRSTKVGASGRDGSGRWGRASRALRRFAFVLMSATAAAPPLGGQSTHSSVVTVVVGPRSPLRNIALSDLQRLYLGLSRGLPSLPAVQLGEYEPARGAFYERALKTSEAAMKRRWIGLIFSGESKAPPRAFRDAAELQRFLASEPSAIAFLPEADVTPAVRILSVNGHLPSQREYPLR